MKRIGLLIIFGFALASVQAQYNSKNSDSDGGSIMDKMYFSGGGGFGTGTGPYGSYTYYSILPTIGYRVKPELLLGVNIMYNKYSYSDIGVSYDQLGFSPFARYYFEQFFAQIEYAKISSNSPDNRPRQFYDRLLIGGGYVQPIGKRSAFNVMGLYDVLYKPNGVFSSPWVLRVFFSF